MLMNRSREATHDVCGEKPVGRRRDDIDWPAPRRDRLIVGDQPDRPRTSPGPRVTAPRNLLKQVMLNSVIVTLLPLRTTRVSGRLMEDQRD